MNNFISIIMHFQWAKFGFCIDYYYIYVYTYECIQNRCWYHQSLNSFLISFSNLFMMLDYWRWLIKPVVNSNWDSFLWQPKCESDSISQMSTTPCCPCLNCDVIIIVSIILSSLYYMHMTKRWSLWSNFSLLLWLSNIVLIIH